MPEFFINYSGFEEIFGCFFPGVFKKKNLFYYKQLLRQSLELYLFQDLENGVLSHWPFHENPCNMCQAKRNM